MAGGRSFMDDILDVSIEEVDAEPSGKLEESESSDELESMTYDEDTGNYLFIIDPTDMTLTEASIATQFLMHQLQQYGEVLTTKDINYPGIPLKHPKTGELINASVEFIYDVVWYLSENHPEQDRFAVVGKTRVGSGSACDVWKVKGKLKPSTTGTLFYQPDKYKPHDQKWVARYETPLSDLLANRTVEIYELTKANRNLGLKYPMWTGMQNKKNEYGMSVSIMRRLKDYDLEDVLNRDAKQPGYLDEILKKDTRWDLCEIFELVEMGVLHFFDLDILYYCRAIAIAYKEQVQDLGLVHRDIKTENIIVDLAKGPVPAAITIIDYSFAGPFGMKDNTICGTPGFIAPELFESENALSTKCDIFSLASIFAQWFGDSSAYDILPEDDSMGQALSSNRKFTQLDANTPDNFKILLHLMVALNPDERPTIEDIIEECEDMIIYQGLEQIRISSSPSAKRGWR